MITLVVTLFVLSAGMFTLGWVIGRRWLMLRIESEVNGLVSEMEMMQARLDHPPFSGPATPLQPQPRPTPQ